MFKHTGDGVCAAFASPQSAVDAAVAAQRALELPVRMGLATGEAELRDGDYFGAVLNRAARVMAAGHGGQILLADSTAGLLSGVDLIDLGPRRLRDLPTPVQVFQVQADGLRTGLSAVAGTRCESGEFAGCDHEFHRARVRGRRGPSRGQGHRLVDIDRGGWGRQDPAGFRSGGRPADALSDGVWFFELAAVTDPAAVPDAVAAALGIIEQPGKTVSQSAAAALEGMLRLVVFDNCEHVLNSRRRSGRGHPGGPRDGRDSGHQPRRMGLADEQLWPVPSLDIGAGIDSAAVSLFIERPHSRFAGLLGGQLPMRPSALGRSAVASTGSRWPSSWRLRGWHR